MKQLEFIRIIHRTFISKSFDFSQLHTLDIAGVLDKNNTIGRVSVINNILFVASIAETFLVLFLDLPLVGKLLFLTDDFFDFLVDVSQVDISASFFTNLKFTLTFLLLFWLEGLFTFKLFVLFTRLTIIIILDRIIMKKGKRTFTHKSILTCL